MSDILRHKLAHRSRHFLIILGFTLLTLLVVGYRFGDGDQNSHIPFLQKTINNDLYPDNSFIELRKDHVSYLRLILAFLVKTHVFSIEIIFFAVFLISLYLLFDAYHQLIKIFVKNNYSYLCLLIFIVPVFSFATFPTHENYLVDRVVAMPFLVYAIAYFLKDRYKLSFTFLGVAYIFHPLTATFVLAMISSAFIFEIYRKRIDVTEIVKSFLIFLVLALPVLFWKFNTSGMDISVQREWYEIISEGVLWHVFHILSLNPPTILLTFMGIGNTAVFIWILKSQKDKIGKIDEILTIFLVAIYFVLFAGVVFSELYPVTIAIQFQLTRIGVFIPVFLYPYFIGFIYSQYKNKSMSRRRFYNMLCITAISGWLLAPLIYYLFISHRKYIAGRVLFIFNTLLLLVGVIVAYTYEIWQPGIYIFPIQNSWHEVQYWVKDNTKISDKFITPVDKWSHYYSDFIVFSQRSSVVTLGELFEIAFHPDYIHTWKERFDDVVPGAILKFKNNYNENRKLVAEIYNQNTTEDFIRIAEKYQANYVIVEKPKTLSLDMVYENSDFLIYKIQ